MLYTFFFNKHLVIQKKVKLAKLPFRFWLEPNTKERQFEQTLSNEGKDLKKKTTLARVNMNSEYEKKKKTTLMSNLHKCKFNT